MPKKNKGKFKNTELQRKAKRALRKMQQDKAEAERLQRLYDLGIR